MKNTFTAAVKYLENYIPTPDKKHPGELGLSRMKYLMELLENPQLKHPTIHVGGTSGKGSTSTIIASILATKYKVGLHTSPHLVKITERIKILSNNKEQITNNKTERFDIPEEEFIDLVNYIKPFVERVGESKLGTPTYFEIITAMAFVYFYRQKVDIAVIEVGMGGRYDATNVIRPLVAVLTNVGLDHTEILGDTVEKIAKDKVGIIKPGIEVISGVRQKSVIRILRSKIKDQRSKLSLLNRDFSYNIKKIDDEGSVFDYKGDNLFKNLKLKLLGKYQIENAAVTIRAIEKLFNYPINQLSNRPINSQIINEENIRNGLMTTYIPGRLEIVERRPLMILDGAHNGDKIKALSASIKKIFPKKEIISVIAIKSDKNVKEMLSELLKISQKVIFTSFKLTGDIGIIRSYNPEELAKIAQTIDKDKQLFIIKDAKKAVAEAIKSAKLGELILITGSLYLVGEIKENYPLRRRAGKFQITNDK